MKVNIFDIFFEILSLDAVKERVRSYLSDSNQHWIVTPNPEILLHTRKDPSYKKVLQDADLCIPDGIGILWASTVLQRFPHKHGHFFERIFFLLYALFTLFSLIFWPKFCRKIFRDRVTGVDLMQDICHDSRVKVFLLGAEPEVNKKARDILDHRYHCIVGSESGSSETFDDDRLTALIRRSEANVLFVAYGFPKQEFWIHRNLAKMPQVKLAMGVGGAFDFIAGKRKRAPRIFGVFGLEWLFRLFQEPKRFRRILNATIKFPIVFMREYF